VILLVVITAIILTQTWLDSGLAFWRSCVGLAGLLDCINQCVRLWYEFYRSARNGLQERQVVVIEAANSCSGTFS